MTALHHSIRRLTVSAYELGCLGLLHGTRARVRRAMGRPDPEPIELTQQMLKRPTTGSLEVKPAWPRDLAIIVIASVAAAAMIAVVAMAKPKPVPSAADLPAVIVAEQTPVVAPTPVPPAVEEPAVVASPAEKPPAKKLKKAKKAKKAKKRKKRRGRKRRRR